jgi:hypothetical protein
VDYSPSRNQLPLTPALEMHRLYPRMMLSPCPEYNATGVVCSLVEKSHDTVAEPSDKDIAVGFVRCESGEVGSGLSGNVLNTVRMLLEIDTGTLVLHYASLRAK